MRIIREGMRRVVEEPGGTGGLHVSLASFSAGKTGTAQNPHGADHAWYVGFAPFDIQKLQIAVMLEMPDSVERRQLPLRYGHGEISFR